MNDFIARCRGTSNRVPTQIINRIRGDNPFEYGEWMIYKGGTISQNLSIYMIIFGIVLMLVFQMLPADKQSSKTR